MSAQLPPRPSASAGAASGRAVICGKIGIATQQQREQAMLLAQVDESHEPAINKTCASLSPSNARIVCFIAVQ
jgi:hypothetical protein